MSVGKPVAEVDSADGEVLRFRIVAVDDNPGQRCIGKPQQQPRRRGQEVVPVEDRAPVCELPGKCFVYRFGIIGDLHFLTSGDEGGAGAVHLSFGYTFAEDPVLHPEAVDEDELPDALVLTAEKKALRIGLKAGGFSVSIGSGKGVGQVPCHERTF